MEGEEPALIKYLGVDRFTYRYSNLEFEFFYDSRFNLLLSSVLRCHLVLSPSILLVDCIAIAS